MFALVSEGRMISSPFWYIGDVLSKKCSNNVGSFAFFDEEGKIYDPLDTSVMFRRKKCAEDGGVFAIVHEERKIA